MKIRHKEEEENINSCLSCSGRGVIWSGEEYEECPYCSDRDFLGDGYQIENSWDINAWDEDGNFKHPKDELE